MVADVRLALRHIPPASDGSTLIASFMLAAAGLAHLSVTPAHFGEWWVFGVLFSLTTAGQLALAAWIVLRPSGAAFMAAVAISLGLIATWSVSRTSGLPFGPLAGAPEPFGPLDVLTTLEEAVLVGLLGIAWLGSRRARLRRPLLAFEASGVTLAVVLTLAFAGGMGHG